MIIAIEDILSEAVVIKLLSVTRPELQISVSLGRKGNSYLKEKAPGLNKTAAGSAVFLLTDRDRSSVCPPALIRDWLGAPAQSKLLFRIAEMEVESWVLADRGAFAEFLNIAEDRIPLQTDTIEKPKEFIVDLARRSRNRELREDLVPAPGTRVRVGPAYNSQLIHFVGQFWNPANASKHSESLARTMLRLSQFEL